MCDLNPPREMQGADLSRCMRGQRQQLPDSAFFQIFGPFAGGGVEAGWRGVRTDRYVYARYEDRPWVLYDRKEDPFELNNLVNDPAARKIAATLDARLSAWMKSTGDSWKFNWTAPVEDGGRLYKERMYRTVQEYLAEHPNG
jgi:arylsulfatase A-like enzyme